MALTTVDSGLISSGAITLTTQVTGTLPEANGGTGTTVGYCGFKNKIFNGQMQIDQRNAGASVTPNNSYTLDRWAGGNTQSSKYTIQQSTTAPTGFKNSLLVTSSSAYSVGSGDAFFFGQAIEGLNVADFGWGAVGAATVTLSFWVRSSLTGTFGGALQNSGNARNYPFSYVINAANTWEQKSVTISGDASGTWLTTNGVGIQVFFGLGCGSTFSGAAGSWASGNIISATGATSVVGTNGATFYITGVQLEKGSTATSFDYRPYGTELALCERYCKTIINGSQSATAGGVMGYSYGSGALFSGLSSSTFRIVPSLSYSSLAHFSADNGVAGYTPSAITISNRASYTAIAYETTGALTAGTAVLLRAASASALLLATAEL